MQAGRCYADRQSFYRFRASRGIKPIFLHVPSLYQDKARSHQAQYEYYTTARYANGCVSIAFDTHNHGSADTLLALLPAPFSALETHTIASASMSRPSASPISVPEHAESRLPRLPAGPVRTCSDSAHTIAPTALMTTTEPAPNSHMSAQTSAATHLRSHGTPCSSL